MSHIKKGYYKLKHPHKYLGKKPPYCRSGMEFKFANYCDTNINVLKWHVEPDYLIVNYYGIDGKSHRYRPDFFVVLKDKHDNIRKLVIEVKPSSQSPGIVKPPKKPKKPTQKNMRNYYGKMTAYKTNELKWQKAREFCKARNFEFIIMTEATLT